MHHYTSIMKEDSLVWAKYIAAGNEIIYMPESDFPVLKKAAIPLWFKWAKKDKYAAKVLKIILKVMQDNPCPEGQGHPISNAAYARQPGIVLPVSSD